METHLSSNEKEEIKSRQIEQSRRQDNKQHCQKILDGINKFDGTTAGRAIWELLQNARDLSEGAEGVFMLEKNRLTFQHKGLPFDYESLTALIKQVSSRSKEETDTAGQFGTGFMTTHKFSRVIHISGSLEVQEGRYAKIEDFKLDRSANELSTLIEAMTSQLFYVDELINAPMYSLPMPETSFVYELDEERKSAAKQGVDAAFFLMPYVMAINDRIKSVRIDDHNSVRSETYSKEEEVPLDEATRLFSVNINKSNGAQSIFYLKSEDGKDIIILPLSSRNEAMTFEGVPRWFIFFPLLGTENFGFNFIFHSARFYPEEPRNSIVLPENNVDKRARYEQNKSVFEQMRTMLYTYLEKYASEISNSHLLAPIHINTEPHLKEDDKRVDYYESLQKELVGKLAGFPLIPTNEGRMSSKQTNLKFFDADLCNYLERDEKYKDLIYDYASNIAILPEKDVILEWSRIVADWKSEEVSYVSVKDIVEYISKHNDNEDLLSFLTFLKDNGQEDYFGKYALIPNREKQKRRVTELRDARDIPSVLYDICKNLIPKETSRFVKEDFAELCNFEIYSRDDLKKDINEFVNSEKSKSQPFENTLNDLLKYCSVFPTKSGDSVRKRAMPFICKLFSCKYNELIITPITGVDVDTEQNLYRTAFDILVEYVLQHIAKKEKDWFSKDEDNRKLHYHLLNALCDKGRPTNYQRKMFLEYAIIPNQKRILCNPKDLKELEGKNNIPQEIQDTLWNFYSNEFGASYQEKLIDDAYAEMVEVEKVSVKSIAREIEDKLKEENFQNSISIELIELIDEEEKQEKFSPKYWTDWFEYINSNKAKIFLERLQGEDRDHTYKFMKAKPNTQKKIAEFLEYNNIDDILNSIERQIKVDREKELDFNYKYRVGKEIERLLREELKEELLEVKLPVQDNQVSVDEEQNGQDIIVRYDGQDIFYIEVKSKWSFEHPAHMSVAQMRKAVLNPDCYALCCVELTNYRDRISEAISRNELSNVLTSEEILYNTHVHLDIGKKLGFYLDKIINEENGSNDDTRIKITDYRSDLNKGFFLAEEKGLKPLVETIRKAKEQLQRF